MICTIYILDFHTRTIPFFHVLSFPCPVTTVFIDRCYDFHKFYLGFLPMKIYISFNEKYIFPSTCSVFFVWPYLSPLILSIDNMISTIGFLSMKIYISFHALSFLCLTTPVPTISLIYYMIFTISILDFCWWKVIYFLPHAIST